MNSKTTLRERLCFKKAHLTTVGRTTKKTTRRNRDSLSYKWTRKLSTTHKNTLNPLSSMKNIKVPTWCNAWCVLELTSALKSLSKFYNRLKRIPSLDLREPTGTPKSIKKRITTLQTIANTVSAVCHSLNVMQILNSMPSALSKYRLRPHHRLRCSQILWSKPRSTVW